ncbi:MAG TPA: isoleucine--tRNA ligase [Candidatus Woesebacteria bacterium]|jgi:isoleucyl-tRNA synthetase|nr:isoleucine--tRNA ligase [Candidatus Shapirobacteria bacterium]HOR01691.1 isoleucine--tRNA ligase [Candidatus Woesebacteria bacterium]
MSKFKNIPQNIKLTNLEEETIKFWKDKKIFEKSVSSRPKDNNYSFYDGPPFITGTPHHGSLLPGIAKDIIPRYWTMKGKRVRRVWGWDCHGLPAENKVEELLGLKSKKDIEAIGIRKYIDACYSYVQNVSKEWPWYIDRTGRWVDFENAYKTMDLDYMESVMWSFSEIYRRGLIYKSHRVSLFCPRCSTPLSNFEIAMDNSYKMVDDPAIFIKFKLKNQDKYIIAWTTTPWTLPANLALAVNQNETYVEVIADNQTLIFAKSRIEAVFNHTDYKIIKEFSGKDLVGLEYEPLYHFYDTTPNDYHIYHGDLVTMTEGTGVVHIAPGFGEDDAALGKSVNLSVISHVDDEGKISSTVTPFANLFVKKADPLIIDDLKSRKLLLKQETINHSYPFCYRCNTPLIYKTQNAWYLDVQKIKDQMIATNQKINWIPDHIKDGRFGQGISTAPDWCLSRSRYWASPIPIWECSCGYRYVPSSIADLETKSGQKITNLHKPDIDEITIKCDKCHQTVHRVPEVLDCWFESGSMPYAQFHYPFENKDLFKKSFPADYIIEYIAQTRGWFYTLHVLSNALFDSESFKNCVVTGVIMGNDGRKMSKLLKNYPDPKTTLQQYGGDAYRLCLMSSVVMVSENINIDEKEFENQYKNILLPLFNSFKYFITYANLHQWSPQKDAPESDHPLDRWIINQANNLTHHISQSLEKYNLVTATRSIEPFVNDLSRWYIRQSRDRFVSGDTKALQTLWQVIIQFSLSTAPIIPFITEYFWQNLVIPIDPTKPESIHLEFYPETKPIDQKITNDMFLIQQICEQGNMIRKTKQISTRQPLSLLTVSSSQNLKLNQDLIEIIKNEINVKDIKFIKSNKSLTIDLDTNITPQLKAEGDARDLVRQIQNLRKELNLNLKDKINIYSPNWPSDFEAEIKSKTLAESITKADQLKIEKVS